MPVFQVNPGQLAPSSVFFLRLFPNRTSWENRHIFFHGPHVLPITQPTDPDDIWTVRIWTVRFPNDIWTAKIWTVKTGLGLGLGFLLGLGLVFGLELVMTVQIMTVQSKTGNPPNQRCQCTEGNTNPTWPHPFFIDYLSSSCSLYAGSMLSVPADILPFGTGNYIKHRMIKGTFKCCEFM